MGEITTAERDYSAQETCFVIMGYKFFRCSREFLTINLNLSQDFEPIDIEEITRNSTNINNIPRTHRTNMYPTLEETVDG